MKQPNLRLFSPSRSAGTQTCISVAAIPMPAAFGLTIFRANPLLVSTFFALFAIGSNFDGSNLNETAASENYAHFYTASNGQTDFRGQGRTCLSIGFLNIHGIHGLLYSF